ncbi:hypothetical protein ACFLYZ_02510 [Thermodesulfobacteriota bacterium]
MSKRSQLIESIVETVADYRKGEIPSPTQDHVERWINQFEPTVQEPMLTELDYVLQKTYITKSTADGFLNEIVTNTKLAGDAPCEFWEDITFLDIQQGGNSQKEMLETFDGILQEKCDLEIEDCESSSNIFFYLDDAIFTGNRVLNDLRGWIESDAPKDAQVNIVVMAFHRGGQHYAKNNLKKTAKDSGKAIKFNWWRILEIEDRRIYTNSSDVLRPTTIPEDELVRKYVKMLEDKNFPPILRRPGNVGENKFFSSESGRNLLEQEFLKAGAKIRSKSPYLNVYQRPLGNMVLNTLGFGSLLVTYRNCPNNCPLAFWAGDPWYPLFQRKTN